MYIARYINLSRDFIQGNLKFYLNWGKIYQNVEMKKVVENRIIDWIWGTDLGDGKVREKFSVINNRLRAISTNRLEKKAT